MSFLLYDLRETGEPRFDNAFSINSWNWSTIVEAIHRLAILPEERVLNLHEKYINASLTKVEVRAVARALREKVIPLLGPNERLLWDGSRTSEPDDYVIYQGEDAHKNYSTNRDEILRFADFCESCNGFEIAFG